MTVRELRLEAKRRGFTRYSRLRKSELVELLDGDAPPRAPTVRALREEAKLLGITGRWRMRKRELAEAISHRRDAARRLDDIINRYSEPEPMPRADDRIDVEAMIHLTLAGMSTSHEEARAMNRLLQGTDLPGDRRAWRGRRLEAIRTIRDREVGQAWDGWHGIYIQESGKLV